MVRRTVTTVLCTGLGTKLLIGFESTTVISAYFRSLSLFSIHPTAGSSQVPFPFVPSRGHPAFKEHAHNGLATALWDCVFLYRLETRLRGLCAFEKLRAGEATAGKMLDAVG